jgi:hypothetical protein
MSREVMALGSGCDHPHCFRIEWRIDLCCELQQDAARVEKCKCRSFAIRQS